MEPKKRSLLWARLACLAVATALLALVFHRIHRHALANAFRQMRWPWFLAAVALYGFLFVPASVRWHLALRQTNCAVHRGATARLTLIGHFLYVILFGAAGGDTAKSALYAKWYRWPLPEILAAASLDRLMGLCGLGLFAGVGLAVALAHHGFSGLALPSLRWPIRWLLIAVVFLALLPLFLKRSRRESPPARFLFTLLTSGRRLLANPKRLSAGLICAVAMQAALSGTLALNLAAVNHAPAHWARLLWVFPVISIIGGVPVTVAGLGAREGAALLLLGLYGVPAADAVAASLLSVAASLVWSVAGGLLLWRESGRQQQRPIPKTISAAVSISNDAPLLAETVRHLRAVPEISEIVVFADEGHGDARDTAVRLGCRAGGYAADRTGQLRLAAEQCTGDVILLLPAGAWLPPQTGAALLDALRDSSAVGGRFGQTSGGRCRTLSGRWHHDAPRFFSVRRFAGAAVMFLRTDVLKSELRRGSSVDEREIWRRLRQAGRFARADAVAIVSGGCASHPAQAPRGYRDGGDIASSSDSGANRQANRAHNSES